MKTSGSFKKGHPKILGAGRKKGCITWNKGKKRPEMLGENHPSWKGGGEGYRKKQAMKRDKYTCQRCGINDKEVLVVDHIIPRIIRSDLVKELSNLVTLCANCHMRKTKIDMTEIKLIVAFGRKKKYASKTAI